MRNGGQPGPDADPERVAHLIVLQRLSTSDRSRAELAEVLRRKLVPDDVAARVLDRFVAAGLIDDASFAQAWVDSRHASRGLARRALRAELLRKGVAVEHIESALASIEDEHEYERAMELARRKSRPGLPRDRQLRRIQGMLARKGYAPSVAARVALVVAGEQGEHDSVDELDAILGAHDLAADEQSMEYRSVR